MRQRRENEFFKSRTNQHWRALYLYDTGHISHEMLNYVPSGCCYQRNAHIYERNRTYEVPFVAVSGCTFTLHRTVPCMGLGEVNWIPRHDIKATIKATSFQTTSIHITDASTNHLRVHCSPRLQVHFSVTRSKYWTDTGAMIAQQPIQLSRVGETKGNAAMTGNYFVHSRVNEPHYVTHTANQTAVSACQ